MLQFIKKMFNLENFYKLETSEFLRHIQELFKDQI